jgi:hypothetical protein
VKDLWDFLRIFVPAFAFLYLITMLLLALFKVAQ